MFLRKSTACGVFAAAAVIATFGSSWSASAEVESRWREALPNILDVGAGADGTVWAAGENGEVHHLKFGVWQEVSAPPATAVDVCPDGTPFIIAGDSLFRGLETDAGDIFWDVVRWTAGSKQDNTYSEGIYGRVQDVGIGASGDIWLVGLPDDEEGRLPGHGRVSHAGNCLEPSPDGEFRSEHASYFGDGRVEAGLWTLGATRIDVDGTGRPFAVGADVLWVVESEREGSYTKWVPLNVGGAEDETGDQIVIDIGIGGEVAGGMKFVSTVDKDTGEAGLRFSLGKGGFEPFDLSIAGAGDAPKRMTPKRGTVDQRGFPMWTDSALFTSAPIFKPDPGTLISESVAIIVERGAPGNSNHNFDGSQPFTITVDDPDTARRASIWLQGALQFAVYPTLSEANPAAGDDPSLAQCMFEIADVFSAPIFSVCMSGDLQSLIIQAGDEVTVLDHDFDFATSMDDPKIQQLFPYLGDIFHLIIEDGLGEVFVERNFSDNGGESLDFFSAPFDLDESSGPLKVTVGGRASGQNAFKGRLGGVRLWSEPIPYPRVQSNYSWSVQSEALPYVPKFGKVVLEAPLPLSNTETDPSTVFKVFSDPIEPEGFWLSDENIDTLKRPNIESEGREGVGLLRNFEIMPAFRVQTMPAENYKDKTARLLISQDGEKGLIQSEFRQVSRTEWEGNQNPVAGAYGATKITFRKGRSSGLSLMTIDVQKGSQVYNFTKVPEYPKPDEEQVKAVLSDSFVFATLVRENHRNAQGFDITLFNPITMSWVNEGGRKVSGAGNKVFDIIDEDDEQSQDYMVANGYIVPHGLILMQLNKGYSTKEMKTISTISDVGSSYGFSVGVKAGVEKVANFSANAGYQQELQTLEEKSVGYSYGESLYVYYDLILDRARVKLEPEFIDAVLDVRAGDRKVSDLIQIYGTHFANAVSYGERARFQSKTDRNSLMNRIKEDWTAGVSGGLQIKAVEVGVDVQGNRGVQSAQQYSVDNESVEVFTDGSPVGADISMVQLGGDPTKLTAIAYDLRRLSQLLSPLYFDDPAIYIDIRNQLDIEIDKHTRRYARRIKPGVSVSPEIYGLEIQELEAVGMGEDVKITGSLTIEQIGRDTDRLKEIAGSETGGAGSPADLELRMASGGKVPLWSSTTPVEVTKGTDGETYSVKLGADKVRTVVALMNGETDAKLKLTLDVQTTGSNLGVQSIEIPLSGLDTVREGGVTESTGYIVAAATCNCVQACSDGYLPDADDNTYCRQACPSAHPNGSAQGLRAAGEQCRGGYTRPTYWTERNCLNDNNAAIGCEKVPQMFGAWAKKCAPGHYNDGLSALSAGCVPICSEFDLEDASAFSDAETSLNAGRIRFYCERPRTERRNVAAQNGMCQAGFEISGNCPNIRAKYTLTRLR